MIYSYFGGSFDPFHNGHAQIINKALKFSDKLFLVPTYLNPFKNNFSISAKKRLELLKKLYNSNPKVEIIDFEVYNKKVFTIDTIFYLKNKYNFDKIYLIIGADNLESLTKWHKFDLLSKIVEFVVFSRNNLYTNKYKMIKLDIDISSTYIRKTLDTKLVPKKIEKEVKMALEQVKVIELIKSILEDKKAEDIEVIDLRDSDYIVDFVVISTALNKRHSLSLVDYLKEDLKKEKVSIVRSDVDEDWSVIDLGDIFIHIMSLKYRQKYSIEEFLADIKK